MATEEIQVPSGAKVELRAGPFEAGIRLKNAIEVELAKHGLSIFPGGVSKETEVDIEKLIPVLLYVDSSPAVNAAIWECLSQSAYNGEKITKATFEPEDVRADYYAIILGIGKKTMLPFIAGAVSGLSGIGSLTKLIGRK